MAARPCWMLRLPWGDTGDSPTNMLKNDLVNLLDSMVPTSLLSTRVARLPSGVDVKPSSSPFLKFAPLSKDSNLPKLSESPAWACNESGQRDRTNVAQQCSLACACRLACRHRRTRI